MEKSDSLGTKSPASGYGIIWGDADRNKQEEYLVRNVIAWIGFNRTADSNEIEVIVLDDQKSRELRRIRTTGLAVYLFLKPQVSSIKMVTVYRRSIFQS